MLIELHALQSFGPSNLNRDDTGNPKEAIFGGVRRARISSQSGKRAIRVSSIFKQAIGVSIGTRTKTLTNEVAQRLVGEGWSEADAKMSAATLIGEVFAAQDKKNADKTNVLVYVSADEFDFLVSFLMSQQEKPSDGKQMKQEFSKRLKNRAIAPDIALFGRMLADNPTINVDAACQMAHALSTHEVTTSEFDYFTAVDDLQPNEESGASMLGLVAYNSATYYRCARIDWKQLVANLHGDEDLALRTVDGFMRAFALVVPTGKQNSFVNQHAPDFLLAVLRPDNDGQTLNNAFEQPVRARHNSGYMAPSIDALTTYWEQVERAFRLSDPTISVMNPRQYILKSEELSQAMRPNLRQWIAAIIDELPRGQA